MHDEISLQCFFAASTGRSLTQVKIFRPFYSNQVDNILNIMQQDPDKLYVIITHDFGKLDGCNTLHELLLQEPVRYNIFLTYSEFLPNQKTYVNKLTLFNLLPYCQNTMANIELLRSVQSTFNLTVSTEQDSQHNKWLCLIRRQTPSRTYVKEQWLEPNPDLFVFSYGEQKFFGNFDVYTSNMPPEVANLENFLSLIPVFNSTGGSIVCECMDTTSFTEKTVHAILALHPVMIIGHPFLIEYLRQQGFDMFDDVIDHSYDQIVDTPARIDRLFRDNQELIKKGFDRRRYMDRLLANQNNLWNYYDKTLNLLQHNIKAHIC